LLFDWDAVVAWCDTAGFRGRSEPCGDIGGDPSASPSAPVPPFELPTELAEAGGFADCLRRIEAVELQSFQDFHRAEAEGRPAMELCRSWLKWVSLLAYLEKHLLKTGAAREEIRHRIQGEVLEHLALWGTPVRETLDRMPAALGAKCNPSDPTCATQTLTDFVNKQLLRLLDRPIFPTEAHEIK
jgi:hypothetical protein